MGAKAISGTGWMGWESPGGGYMLGARNIYPIMNIWSRWLFGQRKVCPLLNTTWWVVLYLPVSSWLDTLWACAMSNPIVTNLILKQKLIGCKFGQNMEGIWTLASNNMVAHWPVSASLATLTQGKCYVKPMTTIWLWRKKPIGCEFCQFMKHISDMKPTFINRLWVCEYCSMTNIKLTEL